MKVTYLLLFYGVFVVLMQGKGQTYTKETLADYSEGRVQVFIAGVSINKPVSWVNWKVMPCSRVLLHSSLTPWAALLGKMSLMGWEGNKSFQGLFRKERAWPKKYWSLQISIHQMQKQEKEFCQSPPKRERDRNPGIHWRPLLSILTGRTKKKPVHEGVFSLKKKIKKQKTKHLHIVLSGNKKDPCGRQDLHPWKWGTATLPFKLSS